MGGSAWHTLPGTPVYKAGASGTVTLPPKAVLISIWVVGGAFTIFGGDSVVVPAGQRFEQDFKHADWAANQGDGSGDIIFTGTTSFFVHYVILGPGT